MSDQKQKESLVSKRPYAPPVVQVYGNIRTITKGKGNNGSFDNGTSGPRTKA